MEDAGLKRTRRSLDPTLTRQHLAQSLALLVSEVLPVRMLIGVSAVCSVNQSESPL